METSVPVLPLTTHGGGGYGHDAAVVRTDPLLGTLIASNEDQRAHQENLRSVEQGVLANQKEIIENRHQIALHHGEVMCRMEQVKNELETKIYQENDKTRDFLRDQETRQLAATVAELKADLRVQACCPPACAGNGNGNN